MKEQLVSLLNTINNQTNGELISGSIDEYVLKILKHASIITLLEQGELVGFIAFYCNNYESRTAYLTMLAIAPSEQGKGIAKHLLNLSLEIIKDKGFRKYELEVLNSNYRAIKLYEKYNFKVLVKVNTNYKMMLEL